jgi:hypothetical protein
VRYKIIINVNIISISRVHIKRSCHLGKDNLFPLTERSRPKFQIMLNAAAGAANGGVYAQTADGFRHCGGPYGGRLSLAGLPEHRGNRRKLPRLSHVQKSVDIRSVSEDDTAGTGTYIHYAMLISNLFKSVTCALLLWVSMMPAAPAHSQILQENDNLPLLYGIKLDGTQIAIDVVSTGCTDASYFSVQLDPAQQDTYRLSIIQRRQDRCRMSAHIVTLALDIPEVPDRAAANFLLMNRLSIPATLPRSDP